MRVAVCLAVLGATLGACVTAEAGGLAYDEQFVPRFNVPRMSKPPTIDGTIGADEWREAVKVMGVVWTSSLAYRDRPVSFWVAWDPQHLYIAARSDILPGHRLYRSKREKYAAGVVFDDSYELGIFLHDRNKLPGQVSSFLKFVINSLGSGEFMKLYPSIGQNLFNWRPDMRIANRIHEEGGKQWWDMELAADLKDVEMPVEHKAGDKMDILLAAPLKNPDWQWLDVPSASGHLEHYGFPRTVLTADKPYVQVEELSGLHDEKLNLKSVIYNPSDKPLSVKAAASVLHGKMGRARERGLPENAKPVVQEEQALTIPAKGSVRFDVAKAFPGLAYPKPDGKEPGELSWYSYSVTLGDEPVYTYNLSFQGTDKSYLAARPRQIVFEHEANWNPVRGLLFLSADTLDAPLPPGAKPTGAEYEITFVVPPSGGSAKPEDRVNAELQTRTVKKGRLGHFVYYKYEDLVELPSVEPGEYQVKLSLVDASGKPVLTRDGIKLAKKDEAKEFAKWWGNKLGDTEKVLAPFEPLRASGTGRGAGGFAMGTKVFCTRRVYHLDSLGLPRQIEANDGDVLAAPARIVVKVGGKEHVVPTRRSVKVTTEKAWRIEFEGSPSKAAGIVFTAKGSVEQDGLVELQLTYAPEAGPVEIEGLRIEWPLDDRDGLHMSCVGQGNNYCARSIGKVPSRPVDGDLFGAAFPAPRWMEVWNTLKGIGLTGSGMTTGSFTDNLWLGTERRGLLWTADSDLGWEPDDKVPAHSLVRPARPGTIVLNSQVILRNNIVGRSHFGKKPLRLAEPRTIRFGYNATPFRRLIPGWRLNQVSAANGFSGGKYKVNWDTGQDFFSILSPPFPDEKRWPEYYAYCKAECEKISQRGLYDGSARLGMWTNNQIALRGYMNKSIEPGVYEYFAGDWVPGGEILSPTYRDYMMWLQNRLIREGGCTHFYYDISFTGHFARALAAGFGYRLPDGRIQPESDASNLREWYKRVWALMQETGQYPGGVSGHATNSICLKALPFADSILDSEYPMLDPISVYPSDRMIAGSCSHNFGVNISHLGFMNPTWPSMHDAVMGGGGGVFNHQAFKHWGISRADVEFIPYWRNWHVGNLTPGLIVSMWKRPGSAVLAVCNYGPDEAGKEQTRPFRAMLELKALGVPAGLSGERLRIRQLYNNPAQYRYLGHLKWYEELPGDPDDAKKHEHARQKVVPPLDPKLDPETGILDGFSVFYHDVRYLVLHWEEKPINDAAWKAWFPSTTGGTPVPPTPVPPLRRAVLDWGINRAKPLAGFEAQGALAWQRPRSVLFHVTNAGGDEKRPAIVKLDLDLARLGIKVEKLWREFTGVVPLDGGPADNITDEPKENDHRLNRGHVLFNGWTGTVWLALKKGESRTFVIDRY
ncbi:MAG: hypothetical protein FJ291_23310 [Planctomycetes bacterium]|nr:hypothetical protein [Planctomycetota bacterium]